MRYFCKSPFLGKCPASRCHKRCGASESVTKRVESLRARKEREAAVQPAFLKNRHKLNCSWRVCTRRRNRNCSCTRRKRIPRKESLRGSVRCGERLYGVPSRVPCAFAQRVRSPIPFFLLLMLLLFFPLLSLSLCRFPHRCFMLVSIALP